MAARRRGLFDVADLLDEEPLSRQAARRLINPLNGKAFSPRYYEMRERRHGLPIWPMKQGFLRELAKGQILIVHGEAAGSGKTTQIPQFLLEAHGLFGRPNIACTQPCMVGAMSVAKRVAEELDVTLGEQVGYSVPFEDCSSDLTMIKFMTDGILVREALSDPLLSHYNVVVVDEAQERTMSTDLLLIILKDLLQRRDDLKLVILSRSDEADNFANYLKQCGTIRMMNVPQTFRHPVEILYSLEEPDDSITAVVQAAVLVHSTQPAGDILLFLPRDMIHEACTDIDVALRLSYEQGVCGPFLVMALHSDLPVELQDRVFQPAPRLLREGGEPIRKIIISTHIAECCLIIQNITYVIDSGIAEEKHYDPEANLEIVQHTRVSKLRALERSLCAGRTRPGRCFRLYTQAIFLQLESRSFPEILTSDISSIVLSLLRLGMKNLVTLDYLDPPAPQALMRALHSLLQLGALDDNANLTLFGEAMSAIPLHPQLATMLLKSSELHCSNEILSIAAMLSAPCCFLRPRATEEAARQAHARLRHIDGDHFTLLNVYNSYKLNKRNPRWCAENFINRGVMRRVDTIREKLLHIMKRLNFRIVSPDVSNGHFTNNIKMALLSGFFMQVAHLEANGNYRTIKYNQVVHINAELGNEEWVLFNEYAMSNNVEVRTVTVITAAMLLKVAPEFCDLGDFPESEAKHGLRTFFVEHLIRMNRRLYGFLHHRPPHVVNDALETLQWLVPVRIELAPPA